VISFTNTIHDFNLFQGCVWCQWNSSHDLCLDGLFESSWKDNSNLFCIVLWCCFVQFVDGNFEQDLHQAILLSKLDYEEKKDLYEQFRKDAEEEKKNAGKRNKKSNRSQPMSLEQFNNLYSELSCESGMGESVTNSKVIEQDEEFFQRIEDDTKKALDREHTLERRKAREVCWIIFSGSTFE